MYKSVPWLCLLVPTGPAWARPAQRYLQETGDEWVKTGNLCASGHSLLNETPSLKLCNCGGQFDCQGTSKFQLLELHVGELNDIDSLQMAVGDDLWPSRRFYMNQDVLELDPEDPTAQPYVYTLISNGIGVGRRFSGAYAGLTSYLGESGTASLQFQGDVHVFRGIPYAEAPVGALRWRQPKPIQRWQGVHDASRYGSHCLSIKSKDVLIKGGSEDCLYLNVYAPSEARANTSLPCLVWIHGGSFETGSSNDYNATNLVNFWRSQQSYALVVTLNYRLNVFGFLGFELVWK
eukprot:s396_g15.t1